MGTDLLDYVLIEMIHQILHRCWFNGIVMGSYGIMEQTIGLMCSNPTNIGHMVVL